MPLNALPASTVVIDQADIDAAIATLTTGAPGTLDTLNELAAAMGDDPNFLAALNTAIANHLADASAAHAASAVAFAPTGTIAATDVQAAVAEAASEAVSGLASKAATIHGHAEADTTGLVADLAAKAPLASPTFTGITTAPEFSASGLTGATGATRYVGGVASGAPTTGTFAVGDYVVGRDGSFSVCTVAGTPGTWKTQLIGAYERVLGYIKLEGDQSLSTAEADMAGLTKTVTVEAGHLVQATLYIPLMYGTSAPPTTATFRIKEGATLLQRADVDLPVAGSSPFVYAVALLTPTAGAHTYKVTKQCAAGTVNTAAGATFPAFLLIEDLGLIPA